jgi:protein-S-isoprenylcysteine O-methyltransferase Ste14/membrane-associated phospholipid phosphatase
VFFLVLIPTLVVIAAWSYFNLDEEVFLLLSQKPVNWNENFWLKAFTYLGKPWLLIWLLLIWFISTGRQRPVLIAFLALIMVSLTVIPVKVTVKRPRPQDIIKIHSRAEGRPDLIRSWSFPSGDTAVVCAVASVIISCATWPWACLVLTACAGVGLLRVTAMAHYPSDVFAGAAIGSFAGWLAVQTDQRWLPLEKPRFNLNRAVATLAIILIPLSFGLYEGIAKLLVLLETYGLLVICIFAGAKAGKHLKTINAITKLADSERFDCALNWLRKRRTLALKIAFTMIIAENIIDGEKPHELGLSGISVMAFIGVVLVFAGGFVRLWVRGHFEKGRLFTTGPYALVRHPLYLGSLLVVSGVLFQLNNWLFNWGVIIPLAVIFYGATIIYEERASKKKFGKQWQLYKAKTPAIIPSMRNWPFKKQPRNWSWKIYLSTHEARVTPMLLCLPIFIELLIEDFVFEGILGR